MYTALRERCGIRKEVNMIKINKAEKNITDTRIASYGILFNNTGKIAIVRKKDWGLILPGGKRENNETSIETIKREVIEEIGYKVNDLCFYEKVEAFYDILLKGKKYYCHLIADIYTGKLSDEIDDPVDIDTSLEWYYIEDIIGKLELDYQNKILVNFLKSNALSKK